MGLSGGWVEQVQAVRSQTFHPASIRPSGSVRYVSKATSSHLTTPLCQDHQVRGLLMVRHEDSSLNSDELTQPAWVPDSTASGDERVSLNDCIILG